MDKLKLVGGIFIFICLGMVIFGFIDHKNNPECYKINRTWSNIENRYIGADIISSLTKNSTGEILPECFVLRSRILNISKTILGFIVFFIGVNLVWSYFPEKEKKEVINHFNNTFKK